MGGVGAGECGEVGGRGPVGTGCALMGVAGMREEGQRRVVRQGCGLGVQQRP